MDRRQCHGDPANNSVDHVNSSIDPFIKLDACANGADIFVCSDARFIDIDDFTGSEAY